MPTLHLLGTGSAVPDPGRTTTMLALEGESVVLVDCGGDAVHRLAAAGVDLERLALLVITHEHPDHVAGFPLFMERIWLGQRRRPIPVAGPAPALSQARRIFEAFDTSGWEGMPEIHWHEVGLEEGAHVWADDEWRITASPGIHSVPVVGLRAEHASGSVAVYSSDTERADAITRLARGADLLVHEGTGEMPGHCSIPAAAEVAREAGAGRLVLVHLPPRVDPEEVARAREIFSALELGAEGGQVEL